MEQRKHWWNGSWGRLSRRDVYLHTDGARWWVEARKGGAEGTSRWFEHPDEGGAIAAAKALFAGPGSWRELR